MNTHCPQCGTQFRITEEQIKLADGYVRCGVCENVFNVFAVAQNIPLENSQQVDNTAGEEPSMLPAETDTAKQSPEDPQSTVSDDSPGNEIDIHAELETDRSDEEQVSATGKIQDDSLDFFNEEVTRSLPHVVPEKFRKANEPGKPSVMSTILWGIGTLILTATLLLEHIWFNRGQYYQSPELMTAVDTLCQQISCEKLSMRDPSKIELTARNIYTHPNVKNALMIDVTIKNTAKFSQPFPVMNISFADLRGNRVASRNFLPQEYLSIDSTGDSGQQAIVLQPDTGTSLTLEIQDPGKQATTYEFDFL